MGSDYERWKKRRAAERARREQESAEESRRIRRVPPPSVEPTPNDPLDALERRTYQGPIPRPAAPVTRPRAQKSGERVRGCLGCLGLSLGGLLLLLVGLLIAGTFYWRQIEQRGKVNVLVLGIDERQTEEGPFRSDTMILSAFNPNQREVALLSIPRDLWLTVPGFGENRVNTAHYFGGPPLAKETVAGNFGVPLHYYVKLNFDGFVALIDAMDGVTIEVPEALHDENYPTPDYGVTTIDIPAGTQEMDGALALIYARSRYSTSDFDRSRRQQALIAAVRDKLASPTTWLKAPAIFTAARSAISTDIPMSEWPALALILVRSEVVPTAIGPEATRDHITPAGAQVLLPIWERINPILAAHFE